MIARSILIGVATLLVGIATVTWWALESEGVAIVETVTSDGALRSTHVWYSEVDGELWLEAGTPENGWFRDVRDNPVLTFSGEGHAGRYVAQPVREPAGHQRIRSLIREKYGFRDYWVGFFVDTSRSVAVKLLPVEEGRREGHPEDPT